MNKDTWFCKANGWLCRRLGIKPSCGYYRHLRILYSPRRWACKLFDLVPGEDHRYLQLHKSDLDEKYERILEHCKSRNDADFHRISLIFTNVCNSLEVFGRKIDSLKETK